MAIDTSTRATYTSALNSYITFCNLHHFPIDPTEDTLSFYTVYMSRHVEPRTVDSYLSGICNQLEPYFPHIRTMRKNLLVSRTLKGCKRLYSNPVKRKLQLGVDDLVSVVVALCGSSNHDDLLFRAMLLTGFHGLLRLAELSMPDNKKIRNLRKLTPRSSVQWHDHAYAFVLPAHKADPVFEGNRPVIRRHPAFPDAVDPYAPFVAYLRSRDKLFRLHPHLWLRSNGKMPTRSWFMARLRHFFPDTRIAGQSMRAGGATALVELGVLPHLIQAAGHWSSEAFKIYIRKNPVLLQAFLFHDAPSTI